MADYHPPAFHRLTPAGEVKARIAGLQSALAQMGLDAALLTHPIDLFYYTGTRQDAHLLVPVDRPALLMVRRNLPRARAESPLEEVVGLSSLKDLNKAAADWLGSDPTRLGLTLDVLPVNAFWKYQSIFPRAAMTDVSPRIMAQRSVKSEYEVDRIRAAGDAAAEVYARVPEMIEEGLTEIELAGRITEAAYALGHQNHLPMRAPGQVMYSWHVISGASGGVLGGLDAAFSGYGLSPAFPMGASTKPIAAGEAVLIDFGLCLDGYMVDLTRMFALGEPPERVKAAYGALQEIEGLLTAMMKPEATRGELFDAAVKKAAQLGFDDAFIGQRGQKVRFVGHGVGLEINEPPILAAGADQRLRPGQVIALELKMTLPGLGAAGLENTVVVQSGGPIKLTPANEAFLVV